MSTIVFGFVGTQLDAGSGPKRWSRWRPTLSIFQHDELLVDELVLLVPDGDAFQCLESDIRTLSPDTRIELVPFPLSDPWDFEEVFGALHDLVSSRPFDTDDDLLIHITTGTHVAQICLFLLTEARYLPGRLLQTSPPRGRSRTSRYDLIDLDLARYDRLAQRFANEALEGVDLLKHGIATANPAFNSLIGQVGRVAVASPAPILITGPTGAGKSRLARQIYALKQRRRLLDGPLVEVNCATLRGDGASSTLFGHRRGAFTGAIADRQGLLMAANGGLLFLDEIGELGSDEQAMLLRAIEERRFMPVGSDTEVHSEFQLIAGTNRDLRVAVSEGRFRGDLLARIDLWTFELPSLADRPEDIEPNLDHELARFARESGQRVSFNSDARQTFLDFARSPHGKWHGNFRDLSAAVTRMSTLSDGGRITGSDVSAEVARLTRSWSATREVDRVSIALGERAEALDRFERVQLEDVLAVVERTSTLSEAGRILFSESRKRRARTNDADRLRKYLAKYGLDRDSVLAAGSHSV